MNQYNPVQLKQTLLYCNDQFSISWQNSFCQIHNDTHVFYFDTNLLNFEPNHFVSGEEEKKANSFFQKQDKLNFLYGRCLTRVLLGKYCNLPPGKISINPNFNKKPYTTIIDGLEPLPIKFNLSHSRNGLLITFSESQVGCDIEAIVDTKYEDLLPSIFTDVETEFVTGSVDPLKSFFKIWVCKEAVLKATGVGLIDNLTQLEVCKKVNMIQTSQLQSNKNFFLTNFEIDDRFIAAVCYEGNKRKNILFFDGPEVLKEMLTR